MAYYTQCTFRMKFFNSIESGLRNTDISGLCDPYQRPAKILNSFENLKDSKIYYIDEISSKFPRKSCTAQFDHYRVCKCTYATV